MPNDPQLDLKYMHVLVYTFCCIYLELPCIVIVKQQQQPVEVQTKWYTKWYTKSEHNKWWTQTQNGLIQTTQKGINANINRTNPLFISHNFVN